MINENMQNSVTLPQWLDHLIFEELGAKYCRSNSDMTVIDWDKNDVLNYLGTYFPRSYAESFCIFSEFFKTNLEQFADKEEISIFDFGCGTGGEIFGFLGAITKYCPNIKVVKITAFDGNYNALRLFESIFNETKRYLTFEATTRVIPLEIEDFYDLSVLLSVLHCDFDVIMTFKAVCEFVSKDRFVRNNPYTHIVQSFVPKLKNDGMMLIEDVTTYNNVFHEWLPNMMDMGLSMLPNYQIVMRNDGYNQTFLVHHTNKDTDVSKVAWRIIQKQK